ncbi:MAG TPA: hypothetical protein VIK18_02080 [Pirellulales bacterium]
MSFGSFLSGTALGGALVFGSLSYHFIRTNDGVQLVPKLSATFTETYLDARSFGLSDWTRHRSVVTAIVRAKKDSIFQGSAVETMGDQMTGLVQDLHGPAGGG